MLQSSDGFVYINNLISDKLAVDHESPKEPSLKAGLAS